MVISKKLSELKNGESFAWKKWCFKKTGDYTAVRQGKGNWDTWMFKRTDVVQVTVPDPPKQDQADDDLYGWHNGQWFNWGIVP